MAGQKTRAIIEYAYEHENGLFTNLNGNHNNKATIVYRRLSQQYKTEQLQGPKAQIMQLRQQMASIIKSEISLQWGRLHDSSSRYLTKNPKTKHYAEMRKMLFSTKQIQDTWHWKGTIKDFLHIWQTHLSEMYVEFDRFNDPDYAKLYDQVYPSINLFAKQMQTRYQAQIQHINNQSQKVA